MKKPIVCYKRSTRLKRSIVKRLVARPKRHNLYFKYRNYKFLSCDESYFLLSNANSSGNIIFYSSDRNKEDGIVRYYNQAKHEDKFLLWVAISLSKISNCYIIPSKFALSQKVYQEECLIKQLLSFIKKHYSMIGMYFGRIRLLHIMQIQYKHGFRTTRSRTYQKQLILQMC